MFSLPPLVLLRGEAILSRESVDSGGGEESVRLIITETDRGKAAAAAAAKEEKAQSEIRRDVLVGRLTDVSVGRWGWGWGSRVCHVVGLNLVYVDVCYYASQNSLVCVFFLRRTHTHTHTYDKSKTKVRGLIFNSRDGR